MKKLTKAQSPSPVFLLRAPPFLLYFFRVFRVFRGINLLIPYLYLSFLLLHFFRVFRVFRGINPFPRGSYEKAGC
jgi:hypothetical protein